MPKTALWSGRLLILVGIIGYAYGLYIGAASLTAFIPAAFGVVLMALGYMAGSVESMRKHLMHLAVIIGLLGFLAALGGCSAKASPRRSAQGRSRRSRWR
jgi:hypothetical protein